jgi:tripeptide aminopeptidase
MINGGMATNIVCDKVTINAEARSTELSKLDRVTSDMRECLEKAVSKIGGSFEFDSELMYSSFDIKEDNDIIGILKNASLLAGLELKLESTGGGSDTNILNKSGIDSVILSIGMDKVHTVEEQIKIDDMVKASEFLLAIVQSVS